MDGPNIFKEVCEHPETHRDAGDDNDELGDDDDEAEAVPIRVSVTPTVESNLILTSISTLQYYLTSLTRVLQSVSLMG